MTIADPTALVDALLDARGALLAAQRMSTPGAPIHKAMKTSITATDEALRLARAIGKASAAA